MPEKILIEGKEILIYKNEQRQDELKFSINNLNIFFREPDLQDKKYYSIRPLS